MTGNTINRNSAGHNGGGLKASASNITLSNNVIKGNSAGNDGAGLDIYIGGSGTLTLENNSINESSVEFDGKGAGAHIECAESVNLTVSVTLTKNILMENSGSVDGVGIYIYGSGYAAINFFKNKITGNINGDNGGGLCIYKPGAATLVNNIVSANSAENGGGAFFNEPKNIVLINNTITTNSSSGKGGGLYSSLYSNSATAQIYNNIIWNNSALSEGDDIYINNDANSDFLPSSVNLYNNDFDQSQSGTYIKIPFAIDPSNLDNADPLFVDALNEDYKLTALSPVINKGNNNASDLPSTDKNGNPRISEGIVDMGAYEFTVLNVEPWGSCGGKSQCYSTIQEAINAVFVRAIIRVSGGTYTESVTLDADKSLTLQGGWDSSFDNQNGQTLLTNAPVVPQGSVTLQELKIRPK